MSVTQVLIAQFIGFLLHLSLILIIAYCPKRDKGYLFVFSANGIRGVLFLYLTACLCFSAGYMIVKHYSVSNKGDACLSCFGNDKS